MTIQQTYQLLQHGQKRNSWLLTVLLLLVLATIGIDYLYSQFQKSAFYLSETLLFSSYWLLYLPLSNIQWKLYNRNQQLTLGLLVVGSAALLHLICYPALVWILSKSFYYHTFPYWQTLSYGLTAYSIKTLIIYGMSLPIFIIGKNNFFNPPIIAQKKEKPIEKLMKSMVVSDNNNKKIVIATDDILYFSANSPYVNIHHQSKKYVFSETLKSLDQQLNHQQFVRIHKSYIVNLCKVVSYQSRLNGDYDLTLTDQTVLRVSRNYAAAFKTKFEASHRLTTE